MDQQAAVTDWKSGRPETPCGAGSQLENTKIIRSFVPHVILNHGIKTVADVGCGDQNWITHCVPSLNSCGIEYVGYDIKPRMVDVLPFDVTREVLPVGYDLVLCIFVLNHMPSEQAERALRLLRESGSEFLLMTYSDADRYALPGNLIGSVPFLDTGRHQWRYGVWKLQG